MTSRPQGEEQAAARELARAALTMAAPDELALLDETADEYFVDPGAALATSRGETTVGFGLELALVGPFVVHGAVTALAWLASTTLDAVKDEGSDVVKGRVRRLVARLAGGRTPADEPAAGLVLSDADVARLRAVTRQSATAAGLDPERAGLVADAVVGALLHPAAG